jgi:GTPase
LTGSRFSPLFYLFAEMSIAQVAIVGRPNVGKSSLFNWMVGRRLAIVDNVAGVTRDRMGQIVNYEGRYFELVDTGGIGINDIDDLDAEIEQQIEYGIRAADLLLFVVDIREGLTALDEQIARRLRSINKPILMVANKSDHINLDAQVADFYRLGFDRVQPVSAQSGRHKDELIEFIHAHIPEEVDEKDIAEPEMKIAIVGRRNVGKSTFINAITETPRMIVSDVAGTTRDSVDVRFELDGRTFVAIDTPGLRKNKSVRTDVEFYSTHRAKRTIRYADVVLMFFESSSRLSKVDKQLVSYIEQHYKPCIFVVNKWDLMAEHMPTERWADYLRENFATLWNVPIAFITAKTGRNVKRLLEHAQMLYKQSLERVGTAELNKLIRSALVHHPPPLMTSKRRPKIYYASQIASQPPTIVLKCNDPDSFSVTYRRYLLSVLRDQLSFGEIPIRLILERRGATEAPVEEIESAD